MRIGIEAQRLFRAKKKGMDIAALELIKGLQKIDHTNEYFIFIKEDQDQEIFEPQNNFHIITLPSRLYPIWEQVTLPKAVKKYKLDLLHCTANTAPLNCSLPLILTLHDIIFLENVNLTKGTWYQRIGNLYRRWNVPRIVDKCKMIATVSNFERDHIIEYFNISPDKIKTLHNGVGNHFQLIKNKPLLDNIRQKYHLPDQFIFAFINKDPRKNAINLLHAYTQLIQNGYDVPLFITESEPGYAKQVMHEIGQSHMIDRLICADYLPDEDMVAIYNLATIFLFPSTREGFGIPIIEAMACGTPVLTSNVSSMPEVAGHAAVLVDPHNPKEILIGLKKLLDDQQLYKACVQKGLQRTKAFRWEETARKYIGIYQNVKGNHEDGGLSNVRH